MKNKTTAELIELKNLYNDLRYTTQKTQAMMEDFIVQIDVELLERYKCCNLKPPAIQVL